MILIICAWIFYFLVSLSIGSGIIKLIFKLSGAVNPLQFGIFYRFWFGFAVLIGILQLFSFFLPISSATFVAIFLLALLFALFNFREIVSKGNRLAKSLTTFNGVLYTIAVLLIIVIVAYMANKEVVHTDTFIYHFNAVRWAKEYPVVPGLANLHGRLGFNSSFFLFAALTDIGIYAHQSAHIALSFLMAVCLIQWFFTIVNKKEMMAKRIFCMMTLPYLIIHVAAQIDITSLATDYPTSVLTLVFCMLLFDRLHGKLLLLLPISAVIFSFKLSGMLAVFMAVIFAVGYILIIKASDRSKLEKKSSFFVSGISLALLAFIALGFVLRNVIVSGWLIYPFPIGNLHLPWSVPKANVLDMMDWIKNYPKIPGGATPATIHSNGFFFWFGQWYLRFRLINEFNIFCAAILILSWAALQVSSFMKFALANLTKFFLCLFSIVSILFWFVSAPDVRFGSIYFYIFFATSVLLLYEGSRQKPILKMAIYIIFLFFVGQQITSYEIIHGPKLFSFPYTKPRDLKRVIGSPAGENPPLYIYMPTEGDACGDSPLPCTPYAGGPLHDHRLIKQRKPGDISKGFLPIEN